MNMRSHPENQSPAAVSATSCDAVTPNPFVTWPTHSLFAPRKSAHVYSLRSGTPLSISQTPRTTTATTSPSMRGRSKRSSRASTVSWNSRISSRRRSTQQRSIALAAIARGAGDAEARPRTARTDAGTPTADRVLSLCQQLSGTAVRRAEPRTYPAATEERL